MSYAEPALLRGAVRSRPRPVRLGARCCCVAAVGLVLAVLRRARRDVPARLAAGPPPAGLDQRRRWRAGPRPAPSARAGSWGRRRCFAWGLAALLAARPAARCGAGAVAAGLVALRVVERVAHGAVRPEAHGPAAAGVAAGGGQPGDARCRAASARAAWLFFTDRERLVREGAMISEALLEARRLPGLPGGGRMRAPARAPGGHDATCARVRARVRLRLRRARQGRGSRARATRCAARAAARATRSHAAEGYVDLVPAHVRGRGHPVRRPRVPRAAARHRRRRPCSPRASRRT